jgi:hypothetical protein
MTSLHKTLLASVGVLSLAAAGCGTSKDSTTNASTSKTETQAKKGAAKKKGAADKSKQDPHACAKLKITPESTAEGTCTRGTNSITLVNGDSTLKLKELDVKVTKVSTTSSISGPAGTVTPKAGKDKKGKSIPKTFVVVDLTWKNNAGKTEQLNSSKKQIKLNTAAGGGPTFEKAEKTDPSSLYNAKPIKDGKKQKVSAIFQVPKAAGQALEQRGARPQLLVWEFSTAGKKKAPPNGAIRLWNT